MDWRPEVHDSDGLALWTGSGERIWRPLNNPGKTVTSAFSDDNPKGFGLLQRDRVFDHYLDGVRYERRPSLWVEPLEPWGRGSVQLVEIPTDDEIHDNIVAMWVPEKPVNGGERRRYSYRLHWTDREPFPTELAECRGLRFGRGGHAGQSRPKGVRKIVIEFAGKPLESLPFGVIPEAVLSASRGSLTNIQVEAVPDDIAGHWRVLFDIDAQGTEPVELRGFLKNGGTVLSETWLYQYHPAAG
jgi:glucans biosynthesis protein